MDYKPKFNKVSVKVERRTGEALEIIEDLPWDASADVYAAWFRKLLLMLSFDPDLAQNFVYVDKEWRDELGIEDGEFYSV